MASGIPLWTSGACWAFSDLGAWVGAIQRAVMGAILAGGQSCRQGRLETSHTQGSMPASGWAVSSRMGLGLGANCGVPERLAAGWQSSPGGSWEQGSTPDY